jgi:hypothetical protein
MQRQMALEDGQQCRWQLGQVAPRRSRDGQSQRQQRIGKRRMMCLTHLKLKLMRSRSPSTLRSTMMLDSVRTLRKSCSSCATQRRMSDGYRG